MQAHDIGLITLSPLGLGHTVLDVAAQIYPPHRCNAAPSATPTTPSHPRRVSALGSPRRTTPGLALCESRGRDLAAGGYLQGLWNWMFPPARALKG